jgi:hypothetical protein
MSDLKNMKKKWGGARPNPGMPKGFKLPKTIEKERAREITRQIITERLEELLAAQIDNALGIKHLMMRDPKTGKFERVAKDMQLTRRLPRHRLTLHLLPEIRSGSTPKTLPCRPSRT